MMFRRMLLAACAVFPLAGQAFAEDVVVSSGREWALREYSFFIQATCMSSPASLTVVTPPLHGVVRTERRKTRIDPKFAAKAGVCVGSEVTAIIVIYRSNAGYIGPDSFGVRVEFRETGVVSTPIEETIRLTVR